MSETISSEELQVTAFDIILHSGNARTLIHEGFKDMRQGKFEEADEQLTKANEEILQAHKAQTNLLTLLEVATEMAYLYQKHS